jgi:hypothetical protein
MKVQPQTLLVYVLLGILTLGYTMVARLGLSIFHMIYDPNGMVGLPLISKLTAQLSIIEYWQIAAWVSFLISLAWGLWRSRKGIFKEPFLVPWVCHISWIMLSFFWNTVGALAPFVIAAYVIE